MTQAEQMLYNISTEGLGDGLTEKLEPHIVVGADRKITVPSELRTLAVVGDIKMNVVTIDCVRYVEGHDLSSFDIFISYVLPNRKQKMHIPEKIETFDGEDYFSFDWKISKEISSTAGQIVFSIIAVKTGVDADGKGIVVNRWGSFTNSDCSVASGLEIAPLEDEYLEGVNNQV